MNKLFLCVQLVLSITLTASLSSAFTFEFGLNGIGVSVMDDRQVLAKAQPDECYYGIGDIRNGPIAETGGQCLSGGVEKTNGAYLWGLAQSNGSLWFGTGANVNCLATGGYLGQGTPTESESNVCEFGQSWVVDAYSVPAQIGDWRPPKLYRYDLLFGELQELSIPESKVEKNENVQGDEQGVLAIPSPHPNNTLGIRSVGAIGDIVIMGGPSIMGGINLFAFNTRNGAYLGAKNFPQYGNIRKWLAFGGQLYAGVGYGESDFPDEGRILKWTGSLQDPFHFEEVGWTDGSVSEISIYGNNRLAVSTWPSRDGSSLAGVFISPVVPSGGLTSVHAKPNTWRKVWDAGDYEPDPVIAKTYGGGALAYYQGYLYWGTMHVMGGGMIYLSDEYGFPGQDQFMEFFEKSNRAVSIFRGKGFEYQVDQVELLYGEQDLPVYNGASKSFSNVTTGWTPLFGSSGFDSATNTYTWTMQVAGNYLFVGTLDYSYMWLN